MEIKNEIKSYLAMSGKTLTEVVDLINKKYRADSDNKETVANLSNKLTRGTIKYREVLEIASVLDYEIQWIRK